MKTIYAAALTMFLFAPISFAADPPAPAAKRTVLSRMDVPSSSYEVVMVLIEVPAHTRVGRHTHPGKVVGYVIDGTYTMVIDGQPPRVLKANDTLEVPSGAVHDEFTTDEPAKLIGVFTIEKGKPLATAVTN